MRSRKPSPHGTQGSADSSPSALSVQLNVPLTKNRKKKRRQKLGKLGKKYPKSQEQSSGFSEGSCTPRDGLAARTVGSSITEICSSTSWASQCSTVTEILPCQTNASNATLGTAAASSRQDAYSDTSRVEVFAAQHAAAASAPPGSSLQQQDFSAAANCISRALQVAAASCPDEEEQLKPKRSRRQYAHGNYHAYYGYRLGTDLDEDPRLQVFQKQWFHNKRCLDIGCNAGLVSIAVAARFGCASMLGVDIDRHLVQQSCRNLSEQRTHIKAERTSPQSHAAPQQLGNPLVSQKASATAQRKAARTAATALAHVWFQHEDFVAAEHAAASQDTVMCLSVTKWVHLNGGDDALKRLFLAIHHVLTPGGHFVLEAQPWRSYKQALRKLDVDAAQLVPLPDLTLRPDSFCDYLTTSLGFTFIAELFVSQSSIGFDRPIWILQRSHT